MQKGEKAKLSPYPCASLQTGRKVQKSACLDSPLLSIKHESQVEAPRWARACTRPNPCAIPLTLSVPNPRPPLLVGYHDILLALAQSLRPYRPKGEDIHDPKSPRKLHPRTIWAELLPKVV